MSCLTCRRWARVLLLAFFLSWSSWSEKTSMVRFSLQEKCSNMLASLRCHEVFKRNYLTKELHTKKLLFLCRIHMHWQLRYASRQITMSNNVIYFSTIKMLKIHSLNTVGFPEKSGKPTSIHFNNVSVMVCIERRRFFFIQRWSHYTMVSRTATTNAYTIYMLCSCYEFYLAKLSEMKLLIILWRSIFKKKCDV